MFDVIYSMLFPENASDYQFWQQALGGSKFFFKKTPYSSCFNFIPLLYYSNFGSIIRILGWKLLFFFKKVQVWYLLNV